MLSITKLAQAVTWSKLVAGCGTEVLLQAASISADWVGNSAVRLPATKSAAGWQGDRGEGGRGG